MLAAICVGMDPQDAETGETWCPDCNNARPFLAPFFAALPQTAAVIEAAVSLDEWKLPTPHVFGSKHASPICSVRGFRCCMHGLY